MAIAPLEATLKRFRVERERYICIFLAQAPTFSRPCEAEANAWGVNALWQSVSPLHRPCFSAVP